MIIDLQKFIADEGSYWMELEALLERIEADPDMRLPLDEVQRFHYLYQRAASDLARISTFSAEPEMRRYLEALTARAYAEINETRERPHRFSPFTWLFVTLPVTFRRHAAAFWFTLAVTLAGMLFGGGALLFDPEAKDVIMPFSHLKDDPSRHVAQVESVTEDHLKGIKMRGAAFYMTHNTQVSIFTMALGVTYGIGTLLMLFYNGVILGGVIADFVNAGQSVFLAAWLGPHGVIELPAVFIAGQAGFVLAGAIIGRGNRLNLTARLREVGKDLVTLISGVALMLVWAGFIEAFLSQYHKAFIPYEAKIAFAAIESVALVLFLGLSGRRSEKEHAERQA